MITESTARKIVALTSELKNIRKELDALQGPVLSLYLKIETNTVYTCYSSEDTDDLTVDITSLVRDHLMEKHEKIVLALTELGAEVPEE